MMLADPDKTLLIAGDATMAGNVRGYLAAGDFRCISRTCPHRCCGLYAPEHTGICTGEDGSASVYDKRTDIQIGQSRIDRGPVCPIIGGAEDTKTRIRYSVKYSSKDVADCVEGKDIDIGIGQT